MEDNEAISETGIQKTEDLLVGMGAVASEMNRVK